MDDPRERRLYGHRGAAALLPENTLASFERALADGANALEMDVHITADQRVVVAHDADGQRVAGVSRAIAETSWSEIQEWVVGRLPSGEPARIPMLETVLERFAGVRLNIDIKPPDPRAVPPVVEVLRRHEAEQRVTLASFHDDVAAEVRRSGFRGELSLSPREVIRMGVLPRPLLRIFPLHGSAVQIPPRYRALDLGAPWIIRRCHALGLRVDYWVINDPAEARHLIEAGADGIFSDDPGRIRSAVLAA